MHAASSSFGDIEGQSVLDLGCGTGILSAACAYAGASHVLGFDVDPDALAIASRNLEIVDDALEGVISFSCRNSKRPARWSW